MNVTEDKINLWAKEISETEEDRCTNAIRQITEVLKSRFGSAIAIIHQGSHKNRTNIRADSDVDIAVVYNDLYFSDVSSLSFSDQQIYWNNLVPSTYSFKQFKNDVGLALSEKFGLIGTIRKNKCIRVEGNSNKVPADVVPAFQSKVFSSLGAVSHQGIGFIADNVSSVQHSFPEHHYHSGVRKNDATENTYKAVVRILKNTRNEMEEKGIIPKDSMPSFFLECLVWNAPDLCFRNNTYREDARSVAATVWTHMREAETHKNYKEVSQLKELFKETHRTPAQAEAFMYQAWNYLTP